MPGSSTLLVLGVCSVLVVVASLAGGWLPLMVRLTHARLQIAISFVAGLMLGLALLHFIPDATEELHSLDRTVAWALGGFLVMFFLQRFLHYHTHDVPGEAAETVEAREEQSEAHEAPHHGQGHDHEQVHEHDHDYDHDHDHEHHHEHDEHGHGGHAPHRLSWVGAAAGLTLHSLLDGVALAAAVSIGSQGEGTLIGLGTALAVILHKPFDAMAISTLMAAGGESRSARHWLNLLYALVTPLGILSFYLGMSHFAESNAAVLGSALGFCAGTFLCISCSDLLPELQFHSHDRVWLSLALLAGLGVAIVILFAETEGSEHGHGAHSAMKWQVPTASRVASSRRPGTAPIPDPLPRSPRREGGKLRRGMSTHVFELFPARERLLPLPVGDGRAFAAMKQLRPRRRGEGEGEVGSSRKPVSPPKRSNHWNSICFAEPA